MKKLKTALISLTAAAALASAAAFSMAGTAETKDFPVKEGSINCTEEYENVVALKEAADLEAMERENEALPGILKKGMRGYAVKHLNAMLTATGYLENGQYGIFTEETELAVKEFQAEHSLKTDGLVGKLTYCALADEYKKL